MHQLLKSQIEKHLGDKKSPDEMKELLDDISKSYEEFERQVSVMREKMVGAEKMAVLGQSLAGIAHEVNTPAAVITGAVGTIKEANAFLINDFIDIVANIDKQELEHFRNICKSLLDESSLKSRTSREIRQVSREIVEILESNQIENASMVGKQLGGIGIDKETIVEAIDLLKSTSQKEIVDALFKIGTSKSQIKDVEISIGRITRIIKALRDYSYTDFDNFAPSDLRQDINNTLVILQNKLKTGIDVIKEYEEIPPISCNADLLNQVWTNLINNSLQAMEGKGTLTIRVRKTDNEEIMVEIEDSGPGIPEEIQDKIFNPYFTTKEKGAGTGLGLDICKEIVTKNRGRIEFDSQPGKTRFRVIIPMKMGQKQKEGESVPEDTERMETDAN